MKVRINKDPGADEQSGFSGDFSIPDVPVTRENTSVTRSSGVEHRNGITKFCRENRDTHSVVLPRRTVGTCVSIMSLGLRDTSLCH